MLGLLFAPAALAIDRTGTYTGGSQGGSYVQPTPAPVEGLSSEVTVLDAGNSSSYALRADGSVWAWGDGRYGQLGDGRLEDSPSTAQRVLIPNHVVTIGEARNSGAAIDASGKAWVWGLNPESSLCVRGLRISTPVVAPIAGAVAVQGGQNHTLWLTSAGTVLACGNNEWGQLGNGKFTDSAAPVEVLGLSGVVEISAGMGHSCARTASGEVWTWGYNQFGQLGDGTTENSSVPVHVPLPGPASEISCGGDYETNGHTLALVAGELFGWGYDNAGQTGNGISETAVLWPVATGLHFQHVIASGQSSFGLDSSGNVWSWGSGQSYALGIGSQSRRIDPTLIDSGRTMISATANNMIDG